MTRPQKIAVSLLTVVAGWFMIGIGYATPLGHPLNTMLFLLGLGSFIGGLIAVITWGRKP